MAVAKESTAFSSDSTLVRKEMLLIKSLMNAFSFILPLVIVHFLLWICRSLSGIEMVRGAWSNNNLHSGWMVCLSNSSNPYLRNMRSMTKLELWLLSAYLVGTGLVGYDRPKERESIMSISKSLWTEWCRYNGSQKLSLMLKSPAIIRTLEMSTSVSLRYFKADCVESE